MNQQKNKAFIYGLIALGVLCFAAVCAFGYVIFNRIRRGSENQRPTVELVTLSEPAPQPETEAEAVPAIETETNAGVEAPPLEADDAGKAAGLAGIEAAETSGTGDEDGDTTKSSETNAPTGEELSEAQQKVISKVEEIRGLTAAEPLTVVFKSREELHEDIVRNFKSALTDQDFQDERELLTMLGFIHADFDFEGLY